MNDLAEFLAIAVPVLLGGGFVLLRLVRGELAPAAGLEPGQRWLLSLALGGGLFAFLLKVAVALAIERAGPERLHAWAATPAGQALTVDDEKRQKSASPDFPNPAPPRPARYVWQSLPAIAPAPPDNPTTPARVALGRQLFTDQRLSADGTLSCASCHDLGGRAGADGRPTARGIAGQIGERNAPTVWNAAFQAELFWDGRAASLEAQAAGPLLNPLEMGLPDAATAVGRLADDAAYRRAFAAAFGDPAITFPRLVQAIAAYERTLIAADPPYDRFVRGDATALDAAQQRGMALFETVGCVLCHRGPNFSDASLLGGENPRRLFPANPIPEGRRYRLLGPDGKPAVWRVPSLRNVALTGPWLHNGSVARLEDVVRIMAGAQLGRSAELQSWLNPDRSLGRVDRAPLAAREVADLVAFLGALSSDALRAGRLPPGTAR